MALLGKQLNGQRLGIILAGLPLGPISNAKALTQPSHAAEFRKGYPLVSGPTLTITSTATQS